MKSKKLLAMLLSCSLIVSAFAACQSSESSSSSASQESSSAQESSAAEGESEGESEGEATTSDAKLTMWVYGWEKDSADKITEDTAAYKEATGVTVEIVPIAVDSYNTKMQATLAGGDNPDLAFIDAGVLSTQLADKGQLLPLKQYGVEEHKDKFYESVWDTLTYKDDVYGLRITANNLALLYNKQLFADAGVAEPTADWTWDDLRSAAQELTDLDNNIYGLDLPIYDDNGGYCWTWLPFLWQSGGDFLNEDRTEVVFNSAEGVKALEFWKSMVQDGSVPLQAAASGVDRFSSGVTAMSINGPWMLNPYLADPDFKDNFGVVPLPADAEEATVVGGEGVVIFNNTEYPQEAYDYLVHLTCSEFTEVFWENWITVPPQPAYADFYADNAEVGQYIQIYSDQMATSHTRPFTPTWPQIEDVMGLELQAYMFDQEDDAQVALDRAAAEVAELL